MRQVKLNGTSIEVPETDGARSPQPTRAERRKTRKRRKQRRNHASVWIVSTGQTPTPGSHSSSS